MLACLFLPQAEFVLFFTICDSPLYYLRKSYSLIHSFEFFPPRSEVSHRGAASALQRSAVQDHRLQSSRAIALCIQPHRLPGTSPQPCIVLPASAKGHRSLLLTERPHPCPLSISLILDRLNSSRPAAPSF